MGNVLTMPRNIRRLRNIEEKVHAVSFTIVLRKVPYKLGTTVICVTAKLLILLLSLLLLLLMNKQKYDAFAEDITLIVTLTLLGSSVLLS